MLMLLQRAVNAGYAKMLGMSVVALYVVSLSRGSKAPQALLGPDFDGVVISILHHASRI